MTSTILSQPGEGGPGRSSIKGSFTWKHPGLKTLVPKGRGGMTQGQGLRQAKWVEEGGMETRGLNNHCLLPFNLS